MADDRETCLQVEEADRAFSRAVGFIMPNLVFSRSGLGPSFVSGFDPGLASGAVSRELIGIGFHDDYTYISARSDIS